MVTQPDSAQLPPAVGIVLNLSPTEPGSDRPQDVAAARRADGHVNRWWLDPLHGLGYPAYGFAIVHVVLAGSDVRRPLIGVSLAASVAVVVALATLRSISVARGRFVALEAR